MEPAPSERPGEPIEIVIVDDHQLFRQGVQFNLETHADLRVVGNCADGSSALVVIRDKQPDVVIMDINLPNMNGIQVTRQLSAERLPCKVVMLTAYDDIEQIIHAMRAGASAYCPKEIDPERLVQIIRYVLQGYYVVRDQVFDEVGIREWMDRGVESVAGQYYADLGDSFTPLSPREMEILEYVTRGLSNKEIAKTLRISHQTVKNHMTAILRKLAVEDRTQAAVFALRRGWVRMSDQGTRPSSVGASRH